MALLPITADDIPARHILNISRQTAISIRILKPESRHIENDIFAGRAPRVALTAQGCVSHPNIHTFNIQTTKQDPAIGTSYCALQRDDGLDIH